MVDNILNKYGHHGVVRVYKEANIYNMYMKAQKAGQVDANETKVLCAQDMCPQEHVPATLGTSSTLGFRLPGTRL